MTKSNNENEYELSELVAKAQGWVQKTNTYPAWFANGKFQRLVSNYRPDEDLGMAMNLFENLDINESLEFKMIKKPNRWIVNLVTSGYVSSGDGETLSVALCRTFVDLSDPKGSQVN